MEAESSPPLDSLVIKRFQGIIVSLLEYARAINNKLIVALISIGGHQASATERTSAPINQLLYYIATYPNGIIAYHARSMVLAGHSNTSLLI